MDSRSRMNHFLEIILAWVSLACNKVNFEPESLFNVQHNKLGSLGGEFLSHEVRQILNEKEVWIVGIVRTNSPTSVRLGDGFGYIGVWATPPNRLTFWDSALSLISGIGAMPQTLDRMCERSPGMDRAQITALWDRGLYRWVGELAFSPAVTTRRPERGYDFLFEEIIEHSANK